MTYRDLLEQLSALSDSQLESHVTVHDMVEDEFYGSDAGIELVFAGSEHGVLDEDHPIVVLRK